MTIPVPSPTGYGALYYPTGGQTQPDPFNGRFGNNPGLLSYLLAANQPMWGAPAPAGGGVAGTPGVGGGTPNGGVGGTPVLGAGGSPAGGAPGILNGGFGDHGNDAGGNHVATGNGGSLPGGALFGGGQWAGPGQINLGQVGRTALQAGSFMPGPLGIAAGLANMGIRGYNMGQFNNQTQAVGVPGLSFGQMLGGILGLNGYGSGNYGANGVIGTSDPHTGTTGSGFGVAPGAALGGYNGQGRPTAIGPINGPFGAYGGMGGLLGGGALGAAAQGRAAAGGRQGGNGGMGSNAGGVGGNGPMGGNGGQGANAGF